MDTRKQGQCPHRSKGPQMSFPNPVIQQRPCAAPRVQQTVIPTILRRAYISAYAKDFTLIANRGEKLVLPLDEQRTEGGMSISGGTVDVRDDGYYMVLWELGVQGVLGEAALYMGVNGAASQLTYALRPDYDSGQQITWLSAGDKLSLLLQTEEDNARIHCGSAQLTVIRLG